MRAGPSTIPLSSPLARKTEGKGKEKKREERGGPGCPSRSLIRMPLIMCATFITFYAHSSRGPKEGKEGGGGRKREEGKEGGNLMVARSMFLPLLREASSLDVLGHAFPSIPLSWLGPGKKRGGKGKRGGKKGRERSTSAFAVCHRLSGTALGIGPCFRLIRPAPCPRLSPAKEMKEGGGGEEKEQGREGKKRRDSLTCSPFCRSSKKPLHQGFLLLE